MPISRRTAGSAAAVVALVVALAAGCDDAKPRPPGQAVRLSAPAFAADPVPKAKALSTGDAPERCGVGAATLRTYAPGAKPELGHPSGPGDCGWYSDTDGGVPYHERILEVGIGLGKPHTGSSADGEALRALDPADPAPAIPDLASTGHPARPVTGLGDEALYTYAAGLQNGLGLSGGATLLVRAGATVATITYRGRDIPHHGPVRQVPEKQARAAVLAAGADLARALHAPAHPAVTSAAVTVPPPRPRTVRPCDLVPAALAVRLAAGAKRERPSQTRLNGQYGQVGDSCQWDVEPVGHRPERHLSVTVIAESEWRLGMAVAQATRQYLERHDDARAAAASGFHAVRGLGDQAYAVYRGADKYGEEGGGEVTFRYRNTVVSVGYTGGEDPLGAGPAVNGAYTVATRALEELR